MMRAGGGLMAESDIIVPVPLHWTRLCMRRYNQAALLANFNGRAATEPKPTSSIVNGERLLKVESQLISGKKICGALSRFINATKK